MRLLFIIVLILIIILNKTHFWGKGNRLIITGEYELAIDIFREKLKTSPNNADIYCRIAYCYQMLGFSNNAIKNYERALEMNNSLVKVYFYLAVLYAENDVKMALKMIDAGREAQKKSGLMNKISDFERNEILGWVHYKSGEIANSFEFYREAIPSWEKFFKRIGFNRFIERYSQVFYRIGYIYTLMGENDKARNYFNNSIKASPKSAFADLSREELKKLSLENNREETK